MGSTKVQVMDISEQEAELKKREKEYKRQQKVREKVDIQEKIDAKVEDNATKPATSHTRSRSYTAARRNVDKTKFYPLTKAIKLVKDTHYAHFIGTINADLNLKDKFSSDITFPHPTGKTVRVVIADDQVLKQIDQGTIDFDVLLAKPELMPKIAKYARTLGPKGLMPNPKNGTVTPDPEKRKKELEAGKTTIKTEKKAPLLHVTVGKTSQDDTELVANLKHLIKIVGPKKISKLTLSATMSPGVKVDLTPFQTG